MSGFTFKVKSKHTDVLARLQKESKQRLRAKVGLLANNGAFYPTNKDTGESVSVNEVGIKNEFGDAHTPPRPFIRTTLSVKKADTKKLFLKLSAELLAGKINLKEATKILGVQYKDWIKTTLDRSPEYFAPNAPFTIAKKGFDHPLIDTGLMYDTIDYKVVKKGSE